jgi:RimJ/RimL family protein N-acetyltransferase
VKIAVLRKGRAGLETIWGAAHWRRSMENMNIHFRQVTQSDINKFPLWYERIGGPGLFSNFIPSTFLSFEESKDLLWFIILDDDAEIGTIWFERKDPDMVGYDLGIYLNRIYLFGKGIGRTVIKSAMDTILSEKDVQGLHLDVRKENIRAIRCYEKLGFKTIYEGEKVTSSGKIKFQRMQKLSTE